VVMCTSNAWFPGYASVHLQPYLHALFQKYVRINSPASPLGQLGLLTTRHAHLAPKVWYGNSITTTALWTRFYGNSYGNGWMET